jgi:GSH-dependent disulfide-bond oxidoreductase
MIDTTPNGHKVTIVPHERQGQKLEDFSHVKPWFDAIAARSTTKRAYELAKNINTQPSVNDEASRKILFGQTAAASVSV